MKTDSQKWGRSSNWGGKCFVKNGLTSLFEVEEDKAEFIVTACNNHYKLIEALNNLIERVEDLSLWDKTHSSYYLAKQLLKQIENDTP